MLVPLLILVAVALNACTSPVVTSERVNTQILSIDEVKSQGVCHANCPCTRNCTLKEEPSFGYYWLPRVRVQIVVQRGETATTIPNPDPLAPFRSDQQPTTTDGGKKPDKPSPGETTPQDGKKPEKPGDGETTPDGGKKPDKPGDGGQTTPEGGKKSEKPAGGGTTSEGGKKADKPGDGGQTTPEGGRKSEKPAGGGTTSEGGKKADKPGDGEATPQGGKKPDKPGGGATTSEGGKKLEPGDGGKTTPEGGKKPDKPGGDVSAQGGKTLHESGETNINGSTETNEIEAKPQTDTPKDSDIPSEVEDRGARAADALEALMVEDPPSQPPSKKETDPDVCKVSLLPPVIEPDPAYLYRVMLDYSAARDDNFSMAITPDGYLSNVGLTTTDESGKAVLKLVDLAAEVAKDVAAFSFPGAGVPLGLLPRGPMLLDQERQKRPKHRFLLSMLIDPTDPFDLDRLQQSLENEQCNLDLSITDAFGAPLYESKVKGNARKRVSKFYGVDIGDVIAGKSVPISDKWFGVFKNQKEAAATISGVAYRPLQPLQIRFQTGPNDYTNSEHVDIRHTLLVPNGSPILSADILRAPLVTTVNSLKFSKGMLTEVAFNKPSTLLAFLSIPVEAAKAIAAIPSSIIQLKIDQTTKQTELLNAQKAGITAREELTRTIADQQNTLLKIQADIENAKRDFTKAQTELVDAQVKALESRIALETASQSKREKLEQAQVEALNNLAQAQLTLQKTLEELQAKLKKKDGE